ncbi:MAG: hypothetical protein Q8P39_00090 [Candidatus Yanofskybacteria bacterium]|nr:hypothetical protein [Candidatus Yanofskybacteria bacterium]
MLVSVGTTAGEIVRGMDRHDLPEGYMRYAFAVGGVPEYPLHEHLEEFIISQGGVLLLEDARSHEQVGRVVVEVV